MPRVSDDLDKIAPRNVRSLIRPQRLETIDFLKQAVDMGRETLDGLVNHNAPVKLIDKQRAFVAEYEGHLAKAEADLRAFDEGNDVFRTGTL